MTTVDFIRFSVSSQRKTKRSRNRPRLPGLAQQKPNPHTDSVTAEHLAAATLHPSGGPPHFMVEDEADGGASSSLPHLGSYKFCAPFERRSAKLGTPQKVRVVFVLSLLTNSTKSGLACQKVVEFFLNLAPREGALAARRETRPVSSIEFRIGRRGPVEYMSAGSEPLTSRVAVSPPGGRGNEPPLSAARISRRRPSRRSP